MKIDRVWAMPNSNTFDITPIGNFVRKYLAESKISIDPFAGDKRWATYTNDLNPDKSAEYHLDAVDFLQMLLNIDIKADLIIFDPPYSPRQIKECYDSIGLVMKYEDAHNTHSWKLQKNLMNELLVTRGIVLCFGWNSMGMGKGRGFKMLEILLVCHGAGHNDTICMAERKLQTTMDLSH